MPRGDNSKILVLYIQCVSKKQTNYFLAYGHQTATKRSNFGTAIYETTASLRMIVFYLTCVMPILVKCFRQQIGYILAINKTVKQ